MRVLVSDTSVLIDLERGNLIETCFTLPYRFAVPDVLYERELRPYYSDDLVALGLEVVDANAEITVLATRYARAVEALSGPDSFAIALAKGNDWELLAGDGALRSLAVDEQVVCRGVLWVFDEIHGHGLATTAILHEALSTIGNHRRCRLPRSEIRQRLELYAGEL